MACTPYQLSAITTACGSNVPSIKKIWVGAFGSAVQNGCLQQLLCKGYFGCKLLSIQFAVLHDIEVGAVGIVLAGFYDLGQIGLQPVGIVAYQVVAALPFGIDGLNGSRVVLVGCHAELYQVGQSACLVGCIEYGINIGKILCALHGSAASSMASTSVRFSAPSTMVR